MIELGDVYKVVVAMIPLYVALFLGYGSVKWWHVFTPEQCDAINRLVCYFTLPLLTFEFTSHVNPFAMNYPFLGADVISKFIIMIVIAFWAKYSTKASNSWSITSYTLSTFSNTLILGVPLLKAMYGQMGEDIIVQSSVMQSLIWQMILLFALEFRRSGTDFASKDSSEPEKDLEGDQHVEETTGPSFWQMMKVVSQKLAKNPNIYACVLGVAWSFPANRWDLKIPSIIEGSIMIMARAGTGTAMFSMGLFMALQKKVIACGPRLTAFGMVLRFIVGPATTAIGAFAVGLRGDLLRVVIIQAALPQAVGSFIFAKEYGLHTEVISTAVIFGTIVSLPVLISYFAILELLH
ncbi:auxin efflux carrier component 5-like [Cornus florida]|uniref:auxin efflux carrier component 5-like n=1 Tax=Cornus florida TaxID=4283 RepID=UPI0028973065|nr:auxin efflux carrier component 5-like [Cornus florida]